MGSLVEKLHRLDLDHIVGERIVLGVDAIFKPCGVGARAMRVDVPGTNQSELVPTRGVVQPNGSDLIADNSAIRLDDLNEPTVPRTIVLPLIEECWTLFSTSGSVAILASVSKKRNGASRAN